MERNKIKIIVSMGIFSVFFISSVILLIANFISLNLVILAMSNMKYITDVPTIVEPVLVVLSGICFLISLFALTMSLLFIKKYK